MPMWFPVSASIVRVDRRITTTLQRSPIHRWRQPLDQRSGSLGRIEHSGERSGFRDLDFSIFKEFGLTETTRLQFRAEAFNLTNTPSFNLPTNTNFQDTANFGQATSTRSYAREIQFALKYYW